VVGPSPLESGYLAPVVALGCVRLVIWFPLIWIRVVAAQGTRVAWWQAFEALLQAGLGPARRLVADGKAIARVGTVADGRQVTLR
jgi:hypothetical protein